MLRLPLMRQLCSCSLLAVCKDSRTSYMRIVMKLQRCHIFISLISFIMLLLRSILPSLSVKYIWKTFLDFQIGDTVLTLHLKNTKLVKSLSKEILTSCEIDQMTNSRIHYKKVTLVLGELTLRLENGTKIDCLVPSESSRLSFQCSYYLFFRNIVSYFPATLNCNSCSKFK